MLEKYDKLAKHFIEQLPVNKRQYVRNNEELIGQIVGVLARADLSYNASRGTSLYTYRRNKVFYYVKKHFWLKYNGPKRNDIYKDSLDINKLAYTDKIYNLQTKKYKQAELEREHIEEVNDRVTKLLNSEVLTDKQKTCINYHYIDGMKYREIAKKLGTSFQNVEQCIKRGVKNLQEFYA